MKIKQNHVDFSLKNQLKNNKNQQQHNAAMHAGYNLEQNTQLNHSQHVLQHYVDDS